MSNQVTRHSFHITEILKDLKERIKTHSGVDVIVGNRPTSVKDSMKEFVVVSMPYSVKNKGAYQTSYMRIEIFVKDKSQGASNIARLNELANMIVGMFPLQGLDGRYSVGDPSLVLQGKDNIGFTIWNLQCSMVINKTDTY